MMRSVFRKIAYPLLAVLVFGAGFVSGRLWKPDASSFHDMIVNHPHDLSALITPRDSRVASLAAELQTPENAYAFVRDMISDDPSLAALPAGDIIEEKRASCLGKAILLCSLYRAMEIPHEDVRIVTGEIAHPYGIVEHVWVETELYGDCLQQDPTNVIGYFTFDQFRGMSYTSSFIRKEGYAFNDVDFAVVSQLNRLKGSGHPPVQ